MACTDGIWPAPRLLAVQKGDPMGVLAHRCDPSRLKVMRQAKASKRRECAWGRRLRRTVIPVAAPLLLLWVGSAEAANLAWIPYDEQKNGGEVPMNAVPGGNEARGAPLYICRAKRDDGIHPGKVFDGKCNVPWGGSEVVASEYQLLVTTGKVDLVWRSGGDLRSAVVGGQVGNKLLRVCRVAHRAGGIAGWLSTDLGTHPGKLANGRCYFSYGGGELVRSDFEFLSVEIPEEPHASVPPKCDAAQPACVCEGSSSCCPEAACSCRSGAALCR